MGGYWLLASFSALQLLFVTERLMNAIIGIFFSKKTVRDTKKLSTRNVLAELCTNFFVVLTIPLQIFVTCIEIVLQNIRTFVVVAITFVLLSLLSQDTSSFIALLVNTWNSGLGVFVNFVFVKPFELLNYILLYFIPLYNSFVYFSKEVLKLFFFDVIQIELNVFLKVVENIMLFFGAAGLSVTSWVSHFAECVVYEEQKISTYENVNSNVSLIPYTSINLNCVGNDNFLLLDAMTPSLYLRNVASNANEMISTVCPTVLLPINIAMYPFLDYNLWMALHTLINSVFVHPFIALPVKTWRRCEYGKSRDFFTEMERVVMCVPDFTHWFALLNVFFKSVGKLIDNWLNTSLVLIEYALGISTSFCLENSPIKSIWDDSLHVLGYDLPLKVVGLTHTLYAVTNGQTTLYKSLSNNDLPQVAIGNWPFEVDVRYGVAAIQQSETFDSDDSGSPRTGMLACRCVDLTSLELQCAAVPYTSHTFTDENDFNDATTIKINFNPSKAHKYLHCDNTMIKITSLRYSRKRFSFGGVDGVDHAYNDLYDVLGLTGKLGLASDAQTFTADAAIFVMPKCDVSSDPACVAILSSCFPFCMGLHTAGTGSTEITLHNAQYWTDFVNVAQVDCAVLTDIIDQDCNEHSFTDSNVWNGMRSDFCSLPQACVPVDYTTTVVSEKNVKHKNKLRPSVRLQGQPFVASGDVLLLVDKEEDGSEFLQIVRLYDNNRGDYTLQNEELAMAQNGKVPLRRNVDDCLMSDEICHINAVIDGKIVIPPSDVLEKEFSHPVASSEWAVHWAVNPDNSVVAAKYAFCHDNFLTQIQLDSSYGPARIWSLKYTRASQATAIAANSRIQDNRPSEHQLISYMRVPDWVNNDTPCDQEVNVKVVDLEYLNEENILITVLRATPRDYNWRTGDVCSTCQYKYKRYFLHPNMARCMDSMADDPIFSCWKDEEFGMFQDSPIRVDDVSKQLGSLCPALRRMPEIGMLGAELAIVSKEIFKILLDIVTVVPPVMVHGNFQELFELRLGKVTFHAALDSSGSRILDVESLITSLDRSMFYAANSLTKMGNLFANFNGYEYIKPQIIGTTKISQYMMDIATLQGPFAMQLKNIKNIPSVKVFSTFSAINAAGLAKPKILTQLSTIGTSFVSPLKFNLRLIRRITMRFLRFATTVTSVSNLGNLLLSILHESVTDFKRSILDSVRVQCDGLSNLLYTDNPFAGAVRNGCLLIPESLEATYNSFLILTIEYPILSCVCRIDGTGPFIEIVTATCMREIMPSPYRYRVNLLRSSTSDDVSRRSLCFDLMDSSNTRLERAFDVFFSRMYKFGNDISETLNFIAAYLGISEQSCFEHIVSPYVITIMPEPLDYFQGCSKTYDCNTRCQSAIDAFQTTFQAVKNTGNPPVYEITNDIVTYSKFYVIEDVEESKHLAPFVIHMLVELDSKMCSTICDMTGKHNRCIFLGGSNPTILHYLESSYYCIPADFFSSVYEHPQLQYDTVTENATMPTGVLIKMVPLTTYKVAKNAKDVIVTLTDDDINSRQFVSLISHISLPLTLEIGEKYANEVAMPTVYSKFDEITSIYSIPAESDESKAFLFIVGSKTQPNNHLTKSCVMKIIDTNFDEDLEFMSGIQNLQCPVHYEYLFSETHLVICETVSCSRIILIPYSNDANLILLSVVKTDSSLSIEVLPPPPVTNPERIRSGMKTLIQTMASDSLYQTQNSVAALNKRIFSTHTFKHESAAPSQIDVMFAGGHNNELSWLHVARIVLQSPDGSAVTDEIDIERTEQIKLVLDCDIDNCIGCNTNPPDNKFYELQARCFDAQQCAVEKCIGTEINMRKPLCNFGRVMTSALDTYRLTMNGLWIGFARTIITFVELSEERRKRYEIDWFDESFFSMTCQTKDVIVESVAIFTSIAGQISYAFFKAEGEWGIGRKLSSTDHAITVMASASMTRLFANVGMLPVYAALAARKTISCGLNDTMILIQNVVGSNSLERVVFEVGSQKLLQNNGNAIGICASERIKQDMMEMAQVGNEDDRQQIAKLFKNEANNMLSQISSRFFTQSFSSYYHPTHAFLTYLLGIISGVEDVIQTIEYKKCKAPLALDDISKCVCGDQIYSIPPRHKDNYINTQYWCTGPMIFNDFNGDEFLIWNPYTLKELTQDNFDSYIACVSKGDTCPAPSSFKFLFFQNQGVDILQVINRCRGNYMNKQWDVGALVYGMFSYNEWQTLDLQPQSYENVVFSKLKKQMFLLSGSMPMQISLSLDTWFCLKNAADSVNWNHRCADEFIVREYGAQSKEHFFVYEPARETTFNVRDSCKSLSGSFAHISENNNAAISPTLWTPRSQNTIPTSKLHHLLEAEEDQRLQYFEETLSQYYANVILPVLNSDEFADYTPDDKIDSSVWSYEGDDIHQTIDCVVMGPYASADLRASFTRNDGSKFPVPQYHRGDPQSRAFHITDARDTSGSFARQSIITKLLDEASEETTEIIKKSAQNEVQRIRDSFRQLDFLFCTCRDENGASIRSPKCCLRNEWHRLDHIEYPTRSVLALSWNIEADVLENLLVFLTNNEILKNDLWTSSLYTPEHIHEFSVEEKEELLNNYVFDFHNKVKNYDLQEVDDVLGTGRTLWDDCTALLSASFFSLPLLNDVVKGNLHYDPLSSSAEKITHKMEEAIRNILSNARAESPVFWSHVHRYVASDSVWCESETVQPGNNNNNKNSHSHKKTLKEQPIFKDKVVSKSLDSHTFVGSLHCHCGWTYSGYCKTQHCLSSGECSSCWNVDQSFNDEWQELCNKYYYNSKEDYFLMLRAMEDPNAPESWTPFCYENENLMTWGLMDQEQTILWWKMTNGQFQESDFSNLNLQHLATNGPAGLRLALLGSSHDEDTLYNYLKSYVHPRTLVSSANYHFNHTVAQPVCRDRMMSTLKSDLREYFADVFIPMAHSIHEAPSIAYCSTWVIEYAILHAFEQLNLPEEELSQQDTHAKTWAKRCEIQLEQIGICLLRDVYNLVPKARSTDPTQYNCTFSLHEHALTRCQNLFYITDNCIVMCNGLFYDPCRCADVDSCAEIAFGPNTCSDGILLDVREFSESENTMLQSLNWPTEISLQEGGSEEIDLTLLGVLNKSSFVYHDFHKIQSIINQYIQTRNVVEGTAPDSFCDDLIDYWPADAQHPVGYHPTCACNREDTNMRGFDNWMSTPIGKDGDDFTHVIETLRMRNMTEFSSQFGSSHTLCDQFVYGKERLELNPFFFESLWNEQETADFHIPLQKTQVDHTEGMQTLGTNPAQDSFDTPLSKLDDGNLYMQHSAGLVRNWFYIPQHGQTENFLQEDFDKTWPHWIEFENNFYQTDHAQDCTMPPLHTCENDIDCATGTSLTLHCKKNKDDIGICVVPDTCYAHEHCRHKGDYLCSGDGYCVLAQVFITNEGSSEVELEIHAHKNDSKCTLDTKGFSKFQGVSNFARDSGICSFRDWYQYQNWTSNAEPAFSNIEGIVRVPNHRFVRSDGTHVEDLISSNVMYQTPHACDKSYQHIDDFSICNFDAYEVEGSTVVPAVHAYGMKTRHEDDTFFCDFHGLNRISGFLNPYRTFDEENNLDDTLKNVPTTLGRCVGFEACPKFSFTVDDTIIQSRQVWNGQITRPHLHSDEEKCGGFGFYREETTDCVVDRLVTPLLWVLYTKDISSSHLPIVEIGATVEPDSFIHSTNMNVRFLDLQKYCPLAYGKDFDKFYNDAMLFVHPYTSTQREEIKSKLNLLLLNLFGNIRGFETINDYIEKSTCAQYILQRLEAYYDTSSAKQVYTQVNPTNPPRIGRTMYMFSDVGCIATPFLWTWQCILLARPIDGGAPINWDARIGEFAEIQCDNYNIQEETTSTLTLKHRLMTAKYLFNTKEMTSQNIGHDLLKDIQRTLWYAIDLLKIANTPDVYCVAIPNDAIERQEIDQTCRFSQPQISTEDCLLRGGRDLQRSLAEVDSTIVGNNLYGIALVKILGSEDNTLTTFASSNFEFYVENGVVNNRIDLEEIVSSNTVFFPSLRFPHVEQFLNEPLPPVVTLDTLDMDDDFLAYSSTELGIYASENSFCEEFYNDVETNLHRLYELKEYEHSFLGDVSEILASVQPEYEQLISLQNEQALRIVLKIFQNEVYNSRFFSKENLHISWELISNQRREEFASNIQNIFEFTQFMKTKSFECGDSVWDTETLTNENFVTLQKCVDGLQQPTGWKIPPESILRVLTSHHAMTNGFSLNFVESIRNKFLDEMTSSLLASKSPLDQQICFAANNYVSSINPFTATDFDIETGCDLIKEDLLLYAVDMQCSVLNGHTCRESFPAYNEGQSQMPTTCMDLKGQVLLRKNTGSFPDFVQNLCDRTFDPTSSCTLFHGSMWGSLGKSVSKLDELHEISTFVDGIWNEKSHKHFFDEITYASENIVGMRLNAYEIGGSSLHFFIRNTTELSPLVLACVSLSSQYKGQCKVAISSWLRNIREMWSWQETILQKHWTPSSTKHWTCPIQWVTSISGLDASHAIRSPSWLRNYHRFRHITTPYQRTHPTVQSIGKVTGLDAGLFMSDIRVCISPNPKECQNEYELRDAILWVRSDQWHVVRMKNTVPACSRMLDWPHVTFRMYDGERVERVADQSCNILDRTPNFAIRKTKKHSVRVDGKMYKSTTEKGGVCHMGRLKRISERNSPGHFMQKCKLKSDTIQCIDVSANGVKSHNWQIYEKIDETRVLNRRKNKKCKKCEDHSKSAFMKSDGAYDTSDLPSTKKQLSVGIPTQLHPSRQLAAHLRRSICPNTTTTCSKLHNFLPDTDWTVHNLLDAVLKNATTRNHTSPVQDDSTLWSRPWLYCNPNNLTESCHGSINKSEWIPPSTRPQKCVEKLLLARPLASEPIQFCKVDTKTRKLCSLVTQWNNAIMLMICQLNAMEECPLTDFFYLPTSFSISNDKFVSTSVHEFYDYMNPMLYNSKCTDEKNDKISSWTNSMCPANTLVPFKIILEFMLKTLQRVLLIFYYFLMTFVKLLEIIVSIFSNNESMLENAKQMFVLYWKIIIFNLTKLWEAIQKLVFEMLMQRDGIIRLVYLLIQELCKAWNKFIDLLYLIGCQFVGIYFEFSCNPNNDLLINFVTGRVSFQDFFKGSNLNALPAEFVCEIKRPFWIPDDKTWAKHKQEILVFYDNCPKKSEDNLLDPQTFKLSSRNVGCKDKSMCPGYLPQHPEYPGCKLSVIPVPNGEHPPCGCDLLSPSKVDVRKIEPLPQPTRCWSTYTTFFGDAAPLSCQPQDTCVDTYNTANDIASTVLCSQCVSLIPGAKKFGCDAITKQCTCSVPEYSHSFCYSNQECYQNTNSNCKFLDSTLQLSSSSVPCSVCVGQTVCLKQPSDLFGTCVCTLHDTNMAKCHKEDHTNSVFAGFDNLCLYSSDRMLSLSTAYIANFDNLMMTPCMNGNPGKSFCYKIFRNNMDVYMILFYDLVSGSRRLLEFDSNDNKFHANASVLKMPQYALTTLQALLYRRLQSWEYIDHDMPDSRYFTTTMHPNQVYAVTTHRRQLKSVDVVLNAAQRKFEEVANLQSSFADQITTIFGTEYSPISDGQAQSWLEVWPPRFAVDFDQKCPIVPKIILHFSYATNNASMFYTKFNDNSLTKRPQKTIWQSWPVIMTFQEEQSDTFEADKENNDFLGKLGLDATQNIFSLFDVKITIVRDVIYSVIASSKNAMICDLENVQLCHKWNTSFFNGLIVVILMYAVAFLFTQSFGLSSIVILFFPLFVFFHLHLTYGYQWTCFPLIPTCLLGDIVSSLNETLPAKFEPIPRALLKPLDTCSQQSIKNFGTLPSQCVVKCSDFPYNYNSPYAPLAWILSEFQIVRFVEKNIMPLLPSSEQNVLLYHLRQKELSHHSDQNHLFHRICSTLHSYRLLPYAFVALLLLAMILSVARLVIPLMYAFIRLIASVFVDAFS